MSEQLSHEHRRTVEPVPGEHVSVAAARMVGVAPSRCVFNGVEVFANVGETTGDVVASYDLKCAKLQAQWEASPAGQRAARDAEHQRKMAQIASDELVNELGGIDFSNLDAVIRWHERAADAFDHVDVAVPRGTILAKFSANGYEPNANVGAGFDASNRENFARYIIGQALDGIANVGSPHQIVHAFAARWREKFGVTA